MKSKLIYVLLLIYLLSACTPSAATTPEAINTEAATPSEANMSLQLTSDAFGNGQSIPAKYSCIGKNISPALAWTEPPAGTQSLALIVDDPDAPGRT